MKCTTVIGEWALKPQAMSHPHYFTPPNAAQLLHHHPASTSTQHPISQHKQDPEDSNPNELRRHPLIILPTVQSQPPYLLPFFFSRPSPQLPLNITYIRTPPSHKHYSFATATTTSLPIALLPSPSLSTPPRLQHNLLMGGRCWERGTAETGVA